MSFSHIDIAFHEHDIIVIKKVGAEYETTIIINSQFHYFVGGCCEVYGHICAMSSNAFTALQVPRTITVYSKITSFNLIIIYYGICMLIFSVVFDASIEVIETFMNV